MIIHARAPLRLGIAGGGSDVSPYLDSFGGAVLNATINKYAYVELKPSGEGLLEFHSSDFGTSERDAVGSVFSKGSQLPLHRAVYATMMENFNSGKFEALSLTTFSDAPVGSGLGASSTLVVAMIKAFDLYFELGLDKHEVAQLAYTIERVDCGLAGGRQDQFSASYGGFNFMKFSADKTEVERLQVGREFIAELESCIVLYYTGVSRSSAVIIEDQSSSLFAGAENSLAAMHAVKAEAQVMKRYIQAGDFEGVVESMRVGWEQKKKTSNSVSNALIDSIYNDAISVGALAGKVSGAGGGGFILFLVPFYKRALLLDALSKYGGVASNCHFTNEGAVAWRLK